MKVRIQIADGDAVPDGALPIKMLEPSEFSIFDDGEGLVLGICVDENGQRLWLKASLTYDPKLRVISSGERHPVSHDLHLLPVVDPVNCPVA